MRLGRSRAEDAAAARRGAEEAERAALRRQEDVERRVARSSEEEGAALQRFLASWNSALEARLERQAAQMAALEQRVGDEARQAAQANEDRLLEVRGRLDGVEEQVARLGSFARDEVREGLNEVARRLGATEARSDALEQRVLDELQDKLGATETAVEQLRGEVRDVSTAARATVAELGDRLGRAQQHAESVAVKMEGSMGDLKAWQEGEIRRASEASWAALSEVQAGLGRAVASAAAALARVEKAERVSSQTAEEAAVRAGQLERELERQMEERLRITEASVTEQLRPELRRACEAATAGAAEVADRFMVMREELRGELHTTLADNNAGIRSLATDLGRLSGELDLLRSQGMSHEWRIPHCMQRLRSLSVAAEPGLWLDSEEFNLGGLGPLALRLYPRGLRGGDGECALALRLSAQAAAAGAPPPLVVELSVGCVSRRVKQARDQEGAMTPLASGAVWLAEGLGDLGVHTVGSDLEDLHVRITFPALVQVEGSSAVASSGLPPPPEEIPARLVGALQTGWSPRRPAPGASRGSPVAASPPGHPSGPRVREVYYAMIYYIMI